MVAPHAAIEALRLAQMGLWPTEEAREQAQHQARELAYASVVSPGQFSLDSSTSLTWLTELLEAAIAKMRFDGRSPGGARLHVPAGSRAQTLIERIDSLCAAPFGVRPEGLAVVTDLALEHLGELTNAGARAPLDPERRGLVAALHTAVTQLQGRLR